MTVHVLSHRYYDGSGAPKLLRAYTDPRRAAEDKDLLDAVYPSGVIEITEVSVSEDAPIRQVLAQIPSSFTAAAAANEVPSAPTVATDEPI